MISSNQAAVFRADLHKLAAEIGVKLELCKDEGQISAGCHLVQARESILAALHAFNPKVDERDLEFPFTQA